VQLVTEREVLQFQNSPTTEAADNTQVASFEIASGVLLVCSERLIENHTSRLFGKPVFEPQMAPNPRFQEAALTVFEAWYNRSAQKYHLAAGTSQIHRISPF
jgi:hypothetical protein